MPLDVVALGETMLSLVAVDGPLQEARTFHATHGGAESNACVGLARRGLHAAFVSRLGADVAGDRILAALRTEGVDAGWVRRDAARPTGVMLRDTSGGVRYWRAGSAASAIEPADLEAVPVDHARAVLVTGITALLGSGPQATALALLDRARGLRAVDPHARRGLWGTDRAPELIRPLLERCDVLLAGEAELASILRTDLRGTELARAAAANGPTEVILRQGTAGAVALAPDGSWHEHHPPAVPEVDPVGAGDAFNAGYLAARLRGGGVPEALREGCAAGAAAVSALGDTG
jgi:2-dehydro-3-deoxygluconokinase